ncbi:hypothetical protein LTR91_009254 [Friedmanniomyces endolithicus]|uniref:Uncharacterized protein n=1 Tax=Friedmanniomyces endolithicus TaxID=329885 RepID=A0AAN6QU34_9PEZI|nr:hypothetical protein LTR94_007587 [Friedmanniomyces endolithicus]KAK0785347.1 hypothetical protein LTR59_011071 [Friedmanniomyces endolithicus]KAK0797007.1 hypothetical protein LTR75_010016 [Friedmanniomyces endolithicus]KAK0812361.1 hypothetical protein LTR38_003383 [Friedmanniomyces endolithicus]KAK0833303.1 hypothetical protein LTR03_014882 [Friedmanniomyces endolithicus]
MATSLPSSGSPSLDTNITVFESAVTEPTNTAVHPLTTTAKLRDANPLAVVESGEVVDDAVSASTLRDQTHDANNLKQMQELLETASPDLIPSPKARDVGMVAFHDYDDENFEEGDALAVLAELKSVNPNMPNLQPKLVVKLRQVIAQNEAFRIALPHSSLGFFLDLCSKTFVMDRDDDRTSVEVARALDSVRIVERHNQESTTTEALFQSQASAVSSLELVRSMLEAVHDSMNKANLEMAEQHRNEIRGLKDHMAQLGTSINPTQRSALVQQLMASQGMQSAAILQRGAEGLQVIAGLIDQVLIKEA